MSRHHRKRGLWPADELSRIVWQLVGALEDVSDLFEASKLAQVDAATALMKKVVVELLSFDDVAKELQTKLNSAAGRSISEPDLSAVAAAFVAYHRAFEPSRKALIDIRHTIAAHRTGLPHTREQRRFAKDFAGWGEWEQELVRLESQCTRERWVDAINVAVALRNVVVNHVLGSWFSTDGATVRTYLPLRFEET